MAPLPPGCMPPKTMAPSKIKSKGEPFADKSIILKNIFGYKESKARKNLLKETIILMQFLANFYGKV